MRLPDRVTGLFLVGLGAAAAYGGWLLPPVPGQPVGPNVFPLVIGSGLALCGSRSHSGSAIPSRRKPRSSRSKAARPRPRRAALWIARSASAGAAAVLCAGGRPARLYHHRRADRIRHIDCARRPLEALASARRAGADRHSSDFQQDAARAAPGRAAADAVVIRC